MYVQAICRTAQDDRLVLAGLVCVEGVESIKDLKVTAGAGLSVDVACGGAFISREDNGTAPCDTQGVYHVYNDATKNLTVAANSTSYIWAQVSDDTYAGASNGWALVVSTSSTNPDATHSWYRLATVVSGASTITSVTDDRKLFRSCGGSGPQQILKFETVGSGSTFDKTAYPNLKSIKVRCIGGGGGSAGAPAASATQAALGGGGGGGGGAESVILAENLPDTPVTITVGAGGPAGGAGANPASGGLASSFGGLVAASGGSAGVNAGPTTSISQSAGRGASGVGTAGDLLIPGEAGKPVLYNPNAASAGWLTEIPSGAASAWGMGAGGTASGPNANAVAATQGYGGGASACANLGTYSTPGTARSGAAGRQGVVIVELYF
jgi:hypothetical protein